MENSNQKKPIDYDKYYGVYKKWPSLLSKILFGLIVVWGFVELLVFKVQLDWDYVNGKGVYDYAYGLMGFDTWFGGFTVWCLIATVAALITYFVTAIKISPVIKSTDALLNIEKSKSEDSEN